MSKPLIQIINLQENTEEIREMNDTELQIFTNEQVKFAEDLTLENEKKKAKADLLKKLGITEDEAKLLLA